MSNHEQRSHKEKKKQPVHTAKEKKAAKRAKKHEGDHPQFLVSVRPETGIFSKRPWARCDESDPGTDLSAPFSSDWTDTRSNQSHSSFSRVASPGNRSFPSVASAFCASDSGRE